MKEQIAGKFELLEKKLKKFEQLNASFDYLKVSIASPEKIRSWAEKILPTGQVYGEIFRPDTINFRTHKPEDFGLFCQKLFGPVHDWKCACGKYSSFFFENLMKVCEKCFVEITESRVRRYRMGYIELMCPVAHYWYIKGTPNYVLTLLKSYSASLKATDLEQILYFKEGVRIINTNNPLYFSFISQVNYQEIISNKTEKLKQISSYKIGAEIVKSALESLSLPFEIQKIRSALSFLAFNSFSPDLLTEKNLIRRLRILENFQATNTNPGWMILTTLPVLPPTLRPLIELENGKLIAADLNELYKLIITRNQRLLEFLHKYEFPSFLSIYVRKLLQESVDALIDNAKLAKNKRILLNNKPLKSLSEILEGKYGRFRHSLLGKRVDFSARSIIIVNPLLRLNQCGIPYEIAIQLFQPFLINELMKLKEFYFNKKLVTRILESKKPFLWTLLNKIINNYSILLNRAPTLHRFGIQAFDPVLTLGQAIQLHPLVCTGFNADFDGDQMAIHLPLSYTSQLEAKLMMRPGHNILSPANADVIMKPTQDIVIGCYYLTLMLNNKALQTINWFKNEEEALIAFYHKKIDLHAPIFIKYSLQDFFLIEKENDIFINFLKVYKLDLIKVNIYNVLKNNNMVYLVSNIGILIGKKEKDSYSIHQCFIETTVGRLIFSSHLQKVYQLPKC